MRAKATIMITVLILAVAIQAQQVNKIFNELQTKTVSAPAPAREPTLGITVSQAMPAEPVPAVVQPAAVAAVIPDDTTETVTVAPEKAGQGVITAGLISLNIKGAELNSVVRLFTELSGANIIVPEFDAIAGVSKVDVNLKNVEWKPALQAILDGQGLELYEKIPGADVYSIRKKLPAAEAIKNTRTFIFKHADIKQASEMIKGIVADRGQVYAYAQGNAIVVKTTQEIMDDVAQIAERIDQPRQQVLIEARILELTDGKNKDRGVDWSKKGVGLLERTLSTTPNLVLPMRTGNLGQNTLPPDTFQELTLNAGQLQVLLSALDQNTDIRTVSNPKVIVANGETAMIEILEKIPKVQRTVNQAATDAGGNVTPASIEVTQDDDGTDPDTGKKRYATYDFGIRLSVKPSIFTEENIAVQITPIITRENPEKSITTFIGKSAGEDIYDTYYAVDEKRVNTTFMLGNKRTAVIGGLTETKTQETQKKVPFLSSIPLIRHLFTYTSSRDVQTENVIFVTVSLEDGKNFDVNKAVQKSPLTRKQLIRDDNNQVVDDRDVELFKKQEEGRIKEDIKIIERKDKVESRDRAMRKPFWSFLRP